MKGQRIAKTRDGRFVPDTHPDAVVLVYNQHDDVPDDVLAKMKSPAENKQRKPRARNKAKAKPQPQEQVVSADATETADSTDESAAE